MRTATTSFLVVLSLFFFTFATKLSLVSAADEPEPVRDITGEILRTGVDYNILSVIYGLGGGGVTKGNNRNGTFCWQYVLQEQSELLKGTPVTFTPIDLASLEPIQPIEPTKGVIQVSTDLNIEFSVEITTCMRPLVWQVAEFDEATKQYFITTRGVRGEPDYDTLYNWFKIEKAGTDLPDSWYKIVYCPSVWEYLDPMCKDIGVYHDEDGTKRLALLSGDVQSTFFVRFARAVDVDQLIRIN